MPAPAVPFTCEKQPATGSRGVVVANHPLASGAGAQMLLAGGNAVDAAVAALFALTVVEPMMVSILGGGLAHIRMADGRHCVLDGISTAPAAATPEMFDPVSDAAADPAGRNREVHGRGNVVGPRAAAVPGALAGWCEALDRFGTVPLEEVLRPAIALAEHGFTVGHYLADCTADTAADLARDPGLAARFLPGGAPIRAGARLSRPEYADTLRLVAREGPAALYAGPLGARLAAFMAGGGGLITEGDLAAYRVRTREPVLSPYRGYEVAGPPPPSSAGVHVAQMLNILEGYDVGGMGFGSPDSVHLMAEAMKIAFADRAAATADPDFVPVPITRLIAKGYAAARRREIDPGRAQAWRPGLASAESADTTHVTAVDGEGNVVATTQTLNGLFGACAEVPGTGMLCNNYMYNFDPHPGRALSIAPGKRVFTSMAPMIVLEAGRPVFALGLPGALRIFPSAMQAIVNLLDHGMTLQQAVEAPRIWTDGGALELEPAFPESLAAALEARGHEVARVRRVAGGMNAVAFNPDGTLTGAACWRADGTPVAIAGGAARAGVRFSM